MVANSPDFARLVFILYSRSVILGLTIVTITYILVNLAFLLVLTPEEIKSSEVRAKMIFSYNMIKTLSLRFWF